MSEYAGSVRQMLDLAVKKEEAEEEDILHPTYAPEHGTGSDAAKQNMGVNILLQGAARMQATEEDVVAEIIANPVDLFAEEGAMDGAVEDGEADTPPFGAAVYNVLMSTCEELPSLEPGKMMEGLSTVAVLLDQAKPADKHKGHQNKRTILEKYALRSTIHKDHGKLWAVDAIVYVNIKDTYEGFARIVTVFELQYRRWLVAEEAEDKCGIKRH